MKNNEFTTKNEFLFFQNEILGCIKKINSKMNEKFNQMSQNIDNQNSINEKNIQNLSESIAKLSKIIEKKSDLEKLESEMKQSLKSMQDLSVKLEIKVDIINKDVKEASSRYDKIISNSLLVPGLVGKGCTHENLRDFIEYANIKLEELIKWKEKQNLDNKLYKEKIEGIIKQNQLELDMMNNKINNIIGKQINKNDNISKHITDDIYQKIEKDKKENDKILEEYKLNLDKLGNDFNKFYNDDWNSHHNLINKLENENKKIIDKVIDINNKLKDLEDFIIPNITSNFKENFNEAFNKRDNINNLNNQLRNNKDLIKRFDIKREANISITIPKRNNTNEQISIINNIDNDKNNNNDYNNIFKENKNIDNTFNKNGEEAIIYDGEKLEKSNKFKNLQTKEVKINKLNKYKSRNIDSNLEKKLYFSEIRNENENYNNIEVIKSGSKTLNINQRQIQNNSIEVRKTHDKNNYDTIEKKGNRNNNLYKVINYKNIFNNNRNININNDKNKRNIGEVNNSNFNHNTIDYTNEYNKNFDESDNVKLNRVSIGCEFNENDLHFVKETKFNLSHAYIYVKTKLEGNKRLKPSNILSSILLKGNNTIKSLGKNKFKFNPESIYLKNKKLKEKEKDKIHDKNIKGFSSYNDYFKENFNSDFPSINKNHQEISSLRNNMSKEKAMYLSYMNEQIQNKNNASDKRENKTQINFYRLKKNEDINKLIRNENNKFGMMGSSSSDFLSMKMNSFNPINVPNQYLDKSNNDERYLDLSY